ncbi:aromatic-L-amino-acid decarboxylase-like [Vespula maculifrons]|uniref:Aromatic-L-amino-acid decarboxylase-like n=1 Tax=Vespula maculifrons TaxID=7453 RepID=A0ABD2B5M2_VESMC
MDVKDFLDFGKASMDFIVNYMETLRDRPVLPNVEPGYLSQLIPEEAPKEAETWQEVFKDIERVIMPGITHWNSPNFYAYYPSSQSYASIIGELLCAGIGGVGFSWICSPAFTELEVITLNWLGKMLNLPSEFLNCSNGSGGGVIQGSASETTMICLIAAKDRKIRRIKSIHPDWDEHIIKSKLVAYSSDQANSSVEKAGLLTSVQMKLLPTDNNCSLRGETLLRAIEKDLKDGLIPCYVCATLGTTGTCAFDNLEEIGPICNQYEIWLHIDAAYAGAAFICPEYRHLMAGVQYADSFNVNCHKWLLLNFDCSAMWVKNSKYLIESLSVNRIYLAYDKEGLAPDYRHWQISLGRRFRSLKLWFVLRLYGIEGMQRHIRNSISLAQKFADYVESDERFELVTNSMALICFRLKGDNNWTKELLTRLTERKRIYVIIASLCEKYIIRFCISSRLCQEKDIEFAWKEISEQATEILRTKLRPIEEILAQSSVKSYDDIVLRIENSKHKSNNITQKIT